MLRILIKREAEASDPRKALADFYGIGGLNGPRGVDAESPEALSCFVVSCTRIECTNRYV